MELEWDTNGDVGGLVLAVRDGSGDLSNLLMRFSSPPSQEYLSVLRMSAPQLIWIVYERNHHRRP
jgi:hypothetical protein